MKLDNPLRATHLGSWSLIDIVCPVCGAARSVSKNTIYRDDSVVMCSYSCHRKYQSIKAASKKVDGRTLRRTRPQVAIVKQNLTRARKERRRYERELESFDVQSNPARYACIREKFEKWAQQATGYEKELAEIEARLAQEATAKEHAG